MTSAGVDRPDFAPGGDVRIRWAQPADAAVVGRLFEQEARYHQELLTTFDLVEGFDWTTMVEGLIGRSGMRIVVADCGGEIVGFAYGRVVGEAERPGAQGAPPLGLRRLARSLLDRFRPSRPAGGGGSQRVRPHPRGIIEDCWVEAHHRRRGVAQRMVDALLEWMAARQVPRVELSVVASNEGAVALWRELGFEPLRHVLHRNVR